MQCRHVRAKTLVFHVIKDYSQASSNSVHYQSADFSLFPCTNFDILEVGHCWISFMDGIQKAPCICKTQLTNQTFLFMSICLLVCTHYSGPNN